VCLYIIFPDPPCTSATLAVGVRMQNGKTYDFPPQVLEPVYRKQDIPPDVNKKLALTPHEWWRHVHKTRQDIDKIDFHVQLGQEVLFVCVCVCVCACVYLRVCV